MSIFSILTMVGGLALFLFGMNTMGDGLVKVSGGKLELILGRLTSKRILAVMLGAGVTAVIQSSSATTVMVVGFVNSGIMKLAQAVGVIMGANIGTTITSWLLSLTGIEGGGVFMTLLKPSSFSQVLAAIGVLLCFTAKNNARRKDVGNILLGFAILMFGMEAMSGAMAPLADNPQFTSILTAFSNPILGIVAGAVLTAVIQSSSASVGILQALCSTGAVPFSVALPIIMGQNIGTCVTALISAVGASKNAKRASMIHLYFNFIGTVGFMVVFYALNHFIKFSFLSMPANAAGIAVVHSLFNIGCCIVWFPFANVLVKLAELTIPDKENETAQLQKDELAVLDSRFLDNPSFAMEICRETTVKMAWLVRDALEKSVNTLMDYSDEKFDLVEQMEQLGDRYEDALGSYLVKLSSKNLSTADSRTLSLLLHCIRDLERISDYAMNVAEAAKSLNEQGQKITDDGVEELIVFDRALSDILDRTMTAFAENDLSGAHMIEPLEEVIDGLCLNLKQRHIIRLRSGKCNMEAGLVLEDVITSLERVSDHCANIAVYMIQISEDGLDTHEYLDRLTTENTSWFQEEYRRLKLKYALPEKKEKLV